MFQGYSGAVTRGNGVPTPFLLALHPWCRLWCCKGLNTFSLRWLNKTVFYEDVQIFVIFVKVFLNQGWNCGAAMLMSPATRDFLRQMLVWSTRWSNPHQANISLLESSYQNGLLCCLSVWRRRTNRRPCCPPMSSPSSWTVWPDGSGRGGSIQ